MTGREGCLYGGFTNPSAEGFCKCVVAGAIIDRARNVISANGCRIEKVIRLLYRAVQARRRSLPLQWRERSDSSH